MGSSLSKLPRAHLHSIWCYCDISGILGKVLQAYLPSFLPSDTDEPPRKHKIPCTFSDEDGTAFDKLVEDDDMLFLDGEHEPATSESTLKLYLFSDSSTVGPRGTYTYIAGRDRDQDQKVRVEVSIDFVATCGPFFKAKFTHAWWRNNNLDGRRAKFNPRAFLRFVRLLYHQRIEEDMPPKALAQLTEVIHFYQCNERLSYQIRDLLGGVTSRALDLGEESEIPETWQKAEKELEFDWYNEDDESDVEDGSSENESVGAYMTSDRRHKCLQYWMIAGFYSEQEPRFQKFTRMAILYWKGPIRYTIPESSILGRVLGKHLRIQQAALYHEATLSMSKIVQTFLNDARYYEKLASATAFLECPTNVKLWPVDEKTQSIIDISWHLGRVEPVILISEGEASAENMYDPSYYGQPSNECNRLEALQIRLDVNCVGLTLEHLTNHDLEYDGSGIQSVSDFDDSRIKRGSLDGRTFHDDGEGNTDWNEQGGGW